MKNGSRDQFCQHVWFSEFDFLHHEVENETPQSILPEKNRKAAKYWHNSSKLAIVARLKIKCSNIV